MNRLQKINKLGSAIRDYRGRTDAETKKWVVHPKPKAKKRVERWLEELGLDADREMKKIDRFKTFAQYSKWILGVRSMEVAR